MSVISVIYILHSTYLLLFHSTDHAREYHHHLYLIGGKEIPFKDQIQILSKNGTRINFYLFFALNDKVPFFRYLSRLEKDCSFLLLSTHITFNSCFENFSHFYLSHFACKKYQYKVAHSSALEGCNLHEMSLGREWYFLIGIPMGHSG